MQNSRPVEPADPTAVQAFLRFWWLWIVVVILIGAAIRFYDLTDPPLDFHPARQLHSALMARGYFAESGGGDYTEQEREQAISLGRGEAIIEPPILEALTAWTYRLFNREVLWAARVYSILFWLLGGLALVGIVRSLADESSALVSLLYFLILPYAVIASRSFQPDPLMVSLMLAGLWALNRWTIRHSWANALAAGLLLGLAILVKQVIAFTLLAGALGLLLAAWNFGALLRNRQAWLIAGLALLPVVLYNIYGLWIARFLSGQYSLRFFPSLWTDPAFYIRWAQQIDQTVGMAPFLLAVLGIFLAQNRQLRGLLIGWLAGYLVYGFVFAHHISTHDYYQLPLIPFVALALAPVAGWILEGLRRVTPGSLGQVVLGLILAAGCLFSLYGTRQTLKKADFRAEPALWYGLAQAMHFDSGGVIGLFDDYGTRLVYYGYINPTIWPTTGDVAFREMAGQQLEPAQFADLTAGKQFFVVTDLAELDRQPDLKAILTRNYPVFSEGNSFQVFDLRAPGNEP